MNDRQFVFVDMIDDCITAICSWLPLETLCSFSLTCKRIYNITNQYFNHHYKNHRMEIVLEASGPRINSNDYYIKCFKSSIRNIRLTSMYYNFNPIHLMTFLRFNCCENLNELELNSIHFKSKHSHDDQIHLQLSNLRTISFINSTDFDIFNVFLRHCHRLQHLIVKEDTAFPMNCSWMLHKYSQLKSFVYYKPGLNDIQMLRDFIRLNGHIKNIGCSATRLRDIVAYENGTLDYLMVYMDAHWIEHGVHDIFNQIQLICQQKSVKRLRLDFSFGVMFTPALINNIAMLASMGSTTALDGISFTAINPWENSVSSLQIVQQNLNDLRMLNLEVAQPILSDTIFHAVQINMPNLQVIELHPWSKKFIDDFYGCIGILTVQLKQLKIIAIHQIDINIISSDSIQQMDIFRKQLCNACPLTIYLPDKIIRSVNFSIPIDSLVNVNLLSSFQRDVFSRSYF